MRPVHRSKCALGPALGFATICGCHGGETVTTRVVTTHVPLGCVSAGQALGGEGYAKFYGSGDFEPTLPAAGHPLNSAGDVLSEIDPASRALVVDVSEGAGRWLGVTLIPAAGNLDVLLLPWMASCGLAPPIASSGATVAPIDAATVLITGGVVAGEASQVAARSQVAHLAIDSVEPIGAEDDLLYPRTHASVTPFGDGALVAGGSAPGAGGAGAVRNTAEVYSNETGAFDQQDPILLSTARTDHGAAVLVTGETLLVGGTDGTNVLASMETVDPATRTVRAVNVAPLAAARREPVVLRLASGEILVAGGIDATGSPVATVEWFLPDVSRVSRLARPLVDDAAARAYVALEGGGALAVFAPPPGADPSYQSVWVIDADGTFEAATPVPGSLTAPVLFGGAGGAPVLWTGDRWLRWQPWSGSFGAFISLDETPPDVGSVGTSPDPGLALWVDPSTSGLTLMRFDTNGPYSPLSGPLLVTDTSDMAPDALAGSGGASFDPSLGLVLPPSRSAFVTDRTYADVDVAVDAPTGEPAVVVLRDQLGDELEVGGMSCPVPRSPDASLSTHVERRGSTVSWSQSSGGMGICPSAVLPNARVSIGVRSGSAVSRSVTTNLRVTRL